MQEFWLFPLAKHLKISLVIPMKDESNSINGVISSIDQQTLPPDEIILVDGGSTDNTIELAERLSLKNPKIKLIKTSQASPGRGRNIGIKNCKNDWVALTDAGIKLECDWLENLAEKLHENPQADIIYGNFSPVTETFFEKCAALTYVAPIRSNNTRGKSIASCLLKKTVWETVGGFPDMRAAEDLIFIEEAEAKGFKAAYSPEAKVYWNLRPDLVSTFRKFILYSKHNVWAGRQWDWHYGVLKQYLLLLPFIILAFLHSYWWLLAIPLWLFARTAKRVLPHRFEFGLAVVLNPMYFLFVMFLLMVIDLATFIGWGQAVLSSKN